MSAAFCGLRSGFFGALLRARRKRRAIRDYVRYLPRLLARSYGVSPTYTPGQIKSAINRSGLDADYSCYALAMYSGRDNFDQYHGSTGEDCDYDAMREEVAHQHFHGHADFTIRDAADLSSNDAGAAADALTHGGGHTGGFEASADSGHGH
jgi:hypothetical protein